MKLGFFGGSFNPPTVAHYNLIKQALIDYNFDKVFFVPMNNYYPKPGLIDIRHRINMLEKLCESDDNIYVSDIETKFHRECKAIDSLRLIIREFSEDDVFFFMGEDNFNKMKLWKDYKELKKFNYIVFQRNENYVSEINQENVIYMKNSENLNISSTIIRKRLRKKESIDEFVNEKVKNYILENNLYV